MLKEVKCPTYLQGIFIHFRKGMTLVLHCHVNGNPLHGLLHKELDHVIDIASLPVDGDLAISAGAPAVFQQGTEMSYFAAASEFVEDIIYEIEEFMQGIAHGQATALGKIDDFGIQSRAHYMPLVLFDEVAGERR